MTDLFDRIRAFALSYPEAHEDFPWGESAFKVRKKVFLFLHRTAEGYSLSTKLPRTHEFALDYPFTRPTGYGLSRSGWVTNRFAADEADPPYDLLEAWIDESYRAVAPKKLHPAPRKP